MESMIEFVHQRISNKEYDIAIDFTMGNGFDTLFLSNYANFVYSFDIQNQALINTNKLIKNKENIKLILDSHENFDKYVLKYDVGIFNLGYLPLGDHEISTQASTTIKALKKAVHYLNRGGNLFIVVYVGHDNGKEESKIINEYVNELDHIKYNVAMFKMVNKTLAPYVLQIEKR